MNRNFSTPAPPGDKMFPNKWPGEKLPHFQSIVEQCFCMSQEISLQIMQAMEIGLGLPRHTLEDRCKPAASEIRLNYYPEVEVAKLDNNLKRTWAHTDFGIITLLFQDSTGGLELEDRRNPGTFIPVAPSDPNGPSEMVVNIADTFQRWANDVIRAGLHRVETPPALKSKKDGVCPNRYSCAFFFKADRNTSAGPLPHFVTAENPAKYDEITALEFQNSRVEKLYSSHSVSNKVEPPKAAAGIRREVEVAS